jgi:hypothetical protein
VPSWSVIGIALTYFNINEGCKGKQRISKSIIPLDVIITRVLKD